MVAKDRRVEDMSWPWTATKAEGGQWLGYKSRWQETWEEELRAAVEKGGSICVAKPMEHVTNQWRRVDDKGDCAQRPSARQRKGTLVAKPHHPGPAAAYVALMGPATARAGLKKAGMGVVTSLGTRGV